MKLLYFDDVLYIREYCKVCEFEAFTIDYDPMEHDYTITFFHMNKPYSTMGFKRLVEWYNTYRKSEVLKEIAEKR